MRTTVKVTKNTVTAQNIINAMVNVALYMPMSTFYVSPYQKSLRRHGATLTAIPTAVDFIYARNYDKDAATGIL
jgi:hypothetical protein